MNHIQYKVNRMKKTVQKMAVKMNVVDVKTNFCQAGNPDY
jgi:hypothetical protein